MSDCYPSLTIKEVRKNLACCGIMGEHAMQAIGTLSGGEQAKVKICLLILTPCNFIIMDEPTNHLDVKYKLSLMEHLKRFHQQGTVIVVLHDLSLAARYCDHAVVMRAGKVIDFGKVENTITAEKMSRLFEVPFYKAVHEDQQFLYC